MAKNKSGRPEWFKFWRRNRPMVDSVLLNMEERGILLTNMFRFFDGEELIPMEPVVSMAWTAIEQNITEAFEDYEKRVVTNHDNGAKGGRPPKNK